MAEVKGNLQGIKQYVIDELNALYDFVVPPAQIVSPELAQELGRLSGSLNREISIYLSRSGRVLAVSVGSHDAVELPNIEGRRGAARLSGIRCIHTHPSGNSQLSGVDFSALRNNKFDMMVALGIDPADYGHIEASFGLITGMNEHGQYQTEGYGALPLEQLSEIFFPNLVSTVEKNLARQVGAASVESRAERALLISIEFGRPRGLWTSEDSLEELKQLADTAGAEVVAKVLQKRSKPDPAFLLGRGKLHELALEAQRQDIDLCIFDEELTPAQQRNIEEVMGVRVLDRTALILDIFAQRARTSEGKLQVELAQLQYNLPRLQGQGLVLSRLGGGIGTRGPGETKLEVDKRRIRDRIAWLKESIEKVRSVRSLHAERRAKSQVPSISLVGYTNAGKSTLLNVLTHSDIYARDQLFATLDPTTRQLELPDKQTATLTDTVGFIQRLPTQLIAAFKSTLEMVCQADLLLHVVDVSHELYREQMASVHNVLEEIGAGDKPCITVYNKTDKLPEGSGLANLLAKEPDSVCISAKREINLDRLLAAIREHLRLQSVEENFLVPYSDGAIVARLHAAGTVLSEGYGADGVELKVRMRPEDADAFAKYIIRK